MFWFDSLRTVACTAYVESIIDCRHCRPKQFLFESQNLNSFNITPLLLLSWVKDRRLKNEEKNSVVVEQFFSTWCLIVCAIFTLITLYTFSTFMNVCRILKTKSMKRLYSVKNRKKNSCHVWAFLSNRFVTKIKNKNSVFIVSVSLHYFRQILYAFFYKNVIVQGLEKDWRR